MSKFEYGQKADTSLKMLGQEGWELVSAVTFGHNIIYYFKREVVNETIQVSANGGKTYHTITPAIDEDFESLNKCE